MKTKQRLSDTEIREPDFITEHSAVRCDDTPTDHVLDVVRMAWIGRRQIFWAAAVGAVTALIIGLLTPNTYRSTTRLMPPEQNSSNVGALALIAKSVSTSLPAGLSDMIGGKNTGALFIGIVDSRTVQDRLIEQCDLRTVYGHPWLHMRARLDSARQELKENTVVTEDRKSGIITLSVTDHDPSRAAAIAKNYVSQLDSLVTRLSTSSAGREREFLETRLKEVKRDLDSATRDLSQFSSKNTTLNPPEQAKAIVTAAATLQGQLIAAESQLRGLQTIYTDSDVRVQTLRANIAELRKQLSTIGGSSSLDSKDPASMPYPSIRQLPLLGATYYDLFRREKIQETVYEYLTQQYEIAKIDEAKEIPVVRVLDEPDIPERKEGPHRLLWLLIGAILGFLLATLWVVARGEWERVQPHNPYKRFLLEVAPGRK
jgi:capsule polysaccharide export protein KpsE/RkpR